jgi:hypothetical protein
MIRIFIGYDPREAVAFHALSHSIHRRSSEPVSITPLVLSQLGKIMWRERNPLQSTDFSFSRFLTPSLCGFEGWSIFMDCDMLVLDDIANLWTMRNEEYAVMCVKHNHTPREDVKFFGSIQTKYEKKNWSSVMLLNNAKCTALTPSYVNEASGLDLHRFNWLGNDELIGEIPHRWNHLVDYDPPEKTGQISNLHYTIGGPYFKETENCSYAKEWNAEYQHMISAG